MQKAPLALLLAGAAIGGLIAMSSSTPPPSLEAHTITAPVAKAPQSSTFDSSALAPIVDEPTIVGAGANKTGSAINAILAQATGGVAIHVDATPVPAAPGVLVPALAARPLDAGAGSNVSPAAGPQAGTAPNNGSTTPTTRGQEPGSPVFAVPTSGTGGGGQAAQPAQPEATTTTTTQPPATTTTTTEPPTTTTTTPPPSPSTDSSQCTTARNQLAKDQATLDRDSSKNPPNKKEVARDQQRVDQDQQNVNRYCST